MAKSEKLYKDSPRVERDKDSGEVGITRPSEADAEDMGIDGNPLPGGGDGMPVQVEQMHDRHKKEMSDMHKRHEDEAKDMHKRHQKEVSKTLVQYRGGIYKDNGITDPLTGQQFGTSDNPKNKESEKDNK